MHSASHLQSFSDNDPGVRRLVFWTACVMALAGSVIGVMLALDPAGRPFEAGLNLAIGVNGCIVLGLLKLGHERWARQWMIWISFLLITLLASQNGGVRGPSVINYPVMIVVCAWALGSRPTIVLSVLIWAALLLLTWADQQHLIVDAAFDPAVNLIFYSAIVVVSAAVTLISRHSYISRMLEAQRLAARFSASQDDLRQHRDHLEDMVNARTEELAAAHAEAERLLRVKGDFLANMSHEIRTPLNGLLGLAQIGLRKSTTPEARADFERMLDTGRVLQGVIDDILDFSKIEAGKLKIEAIPYDLRRVLEQSRDLLLERAGHKGLSLRLSIADNCPAVCLGDPLRVSQILINLLSNAVKFTTSGEIVLSAKLNADKLELAVRDTGIGMNAEQVERVFVAFEQADGSTTRQFGGTGLGLSITHRLTELMGGRITVDSQPGVGSCFTVFLPCIPATLPEARTGIFQTTSQLTGHRLQGLRILVADDVELNRIIIEETLAEEGASIVHAEHGQAAIDCVERDGPDYYAAVLMDVQMPVMDGYAATAFLHQRYPDLPIIGQTANVMEEDQQRCLEVGMVSTVGKPIDVEQLIRTIQKFSTMAPKRNA